ncbi:hypothetical protein FPY71_08920 [Aureimonas fodinaquatilis]|uniref:DUF4345 domain-containing protein n=1 Tax=Aureimonas fodinaquatilis TaxID=2565783 RepID=A0A5B0DYH7_9HYPH|nr:DUF6790 family protein [Aureimonas fodinaquatilis]KAA0970610.1 hypothetical protein FPY71_08920 [Aureimonas fodinaquatilis]
MIGDSIRLFFENIPLVMLIAALAIAALTRTPAYAPERYLAWLLLLSVGVEASWGGFFHVFFPEIASAQIGWQPSPYEFEIGISDLALGITAIISFWRSLSFKSAVVVMMTLSYAGVLIGHVRQAAAGDFSPDNFGLLQVITLLHVILLPALLWIVWRHRKENLSR